MIRTLSHHAGALVARSSLAALGSMLAVLAACGDGGDLAAKAADAEGRGDFVTARATYQEICTKAPKRCPMATQQLDRLLVKEAWTAIGEGAWGKAKTAIDAAKAGTDPSAKAAAEAASRAPEYVQGLALEEAFAQPDKAQALPKVEAAVEEGVPATAMASAKEWLAKNRPAVLLARVKVACAAGAQESCVEAGKALAKLHPTSPENTEAQALVQADYARVYPLLKQAEGLLIQRVEVYDVEQLIDTCMKPGDTTREQCAPTVVGDRHLPTVEFLEKAWQKKLADIGDKALVRALQARYAAAGSAGEHDPEPWPKPAGAK